MTLTILEILYIFLIAFVAVIGVLLSVVLVKVIKILWVVNEITGYYNKAKIMLNNYAKVPNSVKEGVKKWIKNKLKK